MMYAAWTTNDLATTRPLKGVVTYKTGRAGAMAYLKYTPAPPEFFIEQRNGGGRVEWYCQQSVAVLYTWTLEIAGQ